MSTPRILIEVAKDHSVTVMSDHDINVLTVHRGENQNPELPGYVEDIMGAPAICNYAELSAVPMAKFDEYFEKGLVERLINESDDPTKLNQAAA